MSRISITNLTKRYGPTVVVDNFNLEVEQGELVVLLGPSGCGKTTMLRMIAGFIEPNGGAIRLGERDITRLAAFDRNIGIVFQNYALFPHLTVFENVAFGLRRRKIAEAAIKDKVRGALALVRMEHLAQRMPRELSGGQQQRVAIARAIVIAPDILLLDEPLSNLDAKLRLNIRQEIRRLQRTLGITTVLVTHDQEEAMSVADRLVVMSQGRIQQIGTPNDIYARPGNPFVADFIGQANFIAGCLVGGAFITESGINLSCAEQAGGCNMLVIRPEQVKVARPPVTGGPNELSAKVQAKTYLGAASVVECEVGGGLALCVQIGSGDPLADVAEGEEIILRLPPEYLRPMTSDHARDGAAT